MGVVNRMDPPQRVAIMANTRMAKGTEIRIVVMLKGMASRGSMPLRNIWWAHTTKLRIPAVIVE